MGLAAILFIYEVQSMITQQKIFFEDDGTVRLRNTYDMTAAINKAKEWNENGWGYSKDCYCLGFIPEEMKMHDPWLQEAYRAKKEGDDAKYTDYMLRFFRVHQALAINKKKVCWNGYCAPILDGKPDNRPKVMKQLLEVQS